MPFIAITSKNEDVQNTNIFLSALLPPEGYSLTSVGFLLHNPHEIIKPLSYYLLFYKAFYMFSIQGIPFAIYTSYAEILSMEKKEKRDESTAEGLSVRKL